MPKSFNDIKKSIYTTGNKMDWTNAMIRGNGIPLDASSIYETFAEAATYADSSAVAYVGQIIAVLGTNASADTVTVYVITGTQVDYGADGKHYLKKVGADASLNEKAEKAYEFIYGPDGTPTSAADKATIDDFKDDVISPLIDEKIKNKANKATTLSGYGITDAYTKKEADSAIDNKISTAVSQVMKIKQVFATQDAFDNEAASTFTSWVVGDIALITNTGLEYVCTEKGKKPTEKLGDAIGLASLTAEVNTLKAKPAMNITSDQITNWDDANSKKHTHTNKGVIDGITASKVTAWDKAVTDDHTHDNKTVIDGITKDWVDMWKEAYTMEHSHSNSDVLDKLTQGVIDNSHTHANKNALDKVRDADRMYIDNSIQTIKINGVELTKTASQTDWDPDIESPDYSVEIPKGSDKDLGVVKVDNTSISASNGTVSVKQVSTDKLVNGTETLVINCGGAAGF